MNRRRAIDDVAVGQNEAIGREDEPRARTAARSLRCFRMRDLDMDDAGADFLGRAGNRRRVGVEQLRVGRLGRTGRAGRDRLEIIIKYATYGGFHRKGKHNHCWRGWREAQKGADY